MRADKDTRIIGLLGNPLGHSVSPLIHNTAFERMGLNLIYIPFELAQDQFERAIRSFDCFRIAGANVTVPYKTEVMRYLDEIDRKAKLIGAVNVISYEDGILKGYNTDGDGFIRSLKENAGTELGGLNALIIGSGGAARAIAFSLVMNGAERVYITNRTFERAERLSEAVNMIAEGRAVPVRLNYDELKEASRRSDMIVNATTVGMYPDTEARPIPTEIIDKNQLVCDAVYNPLMTALLRDAADKGCDILTGLGMLIYQAIESFRIWTGIEPDYDELYEVAYDVLKAPCT
ncbi:MAG: shikimate dehydrogenase [Thermoanaerobacteraceae bacterium]|nr:shikimate dehydrogenase [Thermoanaerobacteraceae bacterium]